MSQGFLLGPILLLLYTADLPIYSFSHSFAVDNQVINYFDLNNLDQPLIDLNIVMKNVNEFSSNHNLVIIPSKSSTLFLNPKRPRNSIKSSFKINVGS